jgi:hypothetical protein
LLPGLARQSIFRRAQKMKHRVNPGDDDDAKSRRYSGQPEV